MGLKDKGRKGRKGRQGRKDLRDGPKDKLQRASFVPAASLLSFSSLASFMSLVPWPVPVDLSSVSPAPSVVKKWQTLASHISGIYIPIFLPDFRRARPRPRARWKRKRGQGQGEL